jgi:hypothetical protein
MLSGKLGKNGAGAVMDKLVPGIVLAALSALTFVAYRHPDGYQRLMRPIRYVVPVLFTAALVWDISSMRTLSNLYSFIDASKLNEAKAAADNTQMLNWYILGAYFAGMLYLEFLSFLPEILSEEKPPKRKG